MQRTLLVGLLIIGLSGIAWADDGRDLLLEGSPNRAAQSFPQPPEGQDLGQFCWLWRNPVTGQVFVDRTVIHATLLPGTIQFPYLLALTGVIEALGGYTVTGSGGGTPS